MDRRPLRSLLKHWWVVLCVVCGRVVSPSPPSPPPPLACLPPDPPGAEVFYQCEDPDIHTRFITVQINQDVKIEVKCEGNFTCEEFPSVRSEDAGAASVVQMSWCGASLSPQCVLEAAHAPPAHIRALTLTAGSLDIAGLTHLEELTFEDYGDEDNEEWLPMQTLGQLVWLQSLTVSGGRTRLRARQWANMTQLRRLEMIATIHHLPTYAFEGLNNLTDHLSVLNNNVTHIEANNFKGLESLKVLELSRNRIGTVPAGVFVHLHSLKRLLLNQNQITEVKEGAFEGLNVLEELGMNGNRGLASLGAGVFAGAASLRRLRVAGCALARLPPALLHPLPALQLLDLSGNRLSALPENLLRSKLQLVNVSLSNNALSSVPESALFGAPNLQRLWLNNNNITLHNKPYSPFSSLKELRLLDLSHNHIADICDDWRYVLLQLTQLNLSHNNLTGWLQAEKASFSGNILVDLQHNKIEGVFPRLKGDDDPRSSRLLLGDNPLACDCRLYLLMQVVAEPARGDGTQYDVAAARCAAPAALAGRAPPAAARLQCALPAACPPRCACTLRGGAADAALLLVCAEPPAARADLAALGRDRAAVRFQLADLRRIELRPNTTAAATQLLSDLGSVPRNVTALDCSGLNLTAAPASRTPRRPELAEVDLRDNELSEPPPLALDDRSPRLFLAGNRFRCDCAHRGALLSLADRSALVADYDALRCEGGEALRDRAAAALCATRDAAIAGGVLLLLALLVLLAALLVWRCSLRVRLFLEAHGICARWLDDADPDCEWDAFVSYSHLDEKFVVEELVPALEREPRPRALCLHYRDWRAGDTIAANVSRSVQRSRLTVVVLSRNFLASEWGRLEVSMASALQAHEGGRARMLLLLLDDVRADPRLSPELRYYINTRTYLQRDQPAFWRQLRRAVPARVRRSPAISVQPPAAPPASSPAAA